MVNTLIGSDNSTSLGVEGAENVILKAAVDGVNNVWLH